METELKHCCFLQRIPKYFALIIGWSLMGFGLLLFVTPLPGGIVLLLAGAMLVCCKAPEIREKFLARLSFFPALSTRLTSLLKECDRCGGTADDFGHRSRVHVGNKRSSRRSLRGDPG